MLTIRVKGYETVATGIKNLPKELDLQINKRALNEIARRLRMKMIGYAPFATGNLMESIRSFRLKNSVQVRVNAPYAAMQETGFTPHIVPIEYLENHLSNPGARGTWINDPKGFVMVSKSTPFVGPSVHEVIGEMPEILMDKASNAVRRAFLK